MPARNLLSYLLLLCAFVVISSCQDLQVDEVGETYLDLPATRYSYFNFRDTTNAIPTLGRVLFYDRQMSLNNTIACASCHKQSLGFADNQQFSRGFEGRLTTRNSMPIQNLGGSIAMEFDLSKDFVPGPNSFLGSHFFWDGREQQLDKLILQPVGNHIEMGITDVDALLAKLSALPYYAPLFNDAFGTPEITQERISQAVAMFVSSINTTNTRFDRYNSSRFILDTMGQKEQQGQQDIMNPLELEGMMLFQGKYDCNSCHQVTSPNGYVLVGTFANVGLDNVYADQGLAKVTGNPADIGKFKIPSLRNVVYTAPYMHDGRFSTLEDVVEHYSEGIASHPNLDAKLKDESGHARSMNISEHEKTALVAFLRTLSDESVITDPKFSNPFKVK